MVEEMDERDWPCPHEVADSSDWRHVAEEGGEEEEDFGDDGLFSEYDDSGGDEEGAPRPPWAAPWEAKEPVEDFALLDDEVLERIRGEQGDLEEGSGQGSHSS